MLVAVSGTKFSGVEIFIDLLTQKHGFELVSHKSRNAEEILDYITRNYQHDMVIECDSLELFNVLEKRPFLVHITLDAAISLRLAIMDQSLGATKHEIETITALEQHDYREPFLRLREKAHIKFKILNSMQGPSNLPSVAIVEDFKRRLSDALDAQVQILRNPKPTKQDELNPPLRPDWDTYFMRLAMLAASRSNCMKRRVGCVIVRDDRVIATGYNGTPRHLRNCFNGGCTRCNGGDSHNLHTCLCLHAEENALLEAGRDRVGKNAILYCDTCPCLTCSVKIVQIGIKEVVYSQSYSMDEASFNVLREGGVKVRQFYFSEEPKIVII